MSGLLVALLRSSQAFSGLSAISGLIGAWTIIAVRTLQAPAAGWVAFACGLSLVLVSVRALALHETTIERIVYALDGESTGDQEPAGTTDTGMVRRFTVSAPMHSWLTNTAIIGGFIVVLTFALTRPGTSHISPRWIAFALAIGAASIAIGSLLDRTLLRRPNLTADWTTEGRVPLMALAATNLAAGVALIVTMILYSGATARWIAFGLGCAMVGVSLVAMAVHEITSERVRYELEVARPATSTTPAPTIGASEIS